MKKKRFLIVDGNLLLHKCHGVHGRLSVKLKGERVPTGIPYGFLRTLVRLNGMYQPCSTCVAFDHSVLPPEEKVKAKIFKPAKDVPPRRLTYADYKCSRSALKPEIYSGKLLLDEFLQHIGVTVVYASGIYEADDVVAYVTHRCSLRSDKKGFKGEVVIISDDKDFNQLVHDEDNFSVTVHRRGDKVTSQESFLKLNGFHPADTLIYLSLTGDANDDIPGIKGIGEVTATKLVKKGLRAIERSLSSSEWGIFQRNLSLISLSRSRRAISSLSYNSFDKNKLNMLLNRYKMVSFLRGGEQEIISNIKPVKFLKEQ